MEAVNTTVIGDNATSAAQAVLSVPASTLETPTDFATTLSTRVCPQCNSLFGAEVLSQIPPMTAQTAVEADFHRLLPHVSFRGALVTVCPACEYSSWVQDFGAHIFPAELVPAAVELEPSIRYAYAIKKGRELESPVLNLALLSLNGLWCARQENKPSAPWLELTIKELTAALDDDSWRGNRAYYLYLRAEIRRQNSEFESSLRDFEQTTPQMKVPRELIQRQQQLAAAGNCEPVFLAPHMVEQIFCFKPMTLEAA
jgi:hypothetical protein